ncbi:MAG TPA: hypothetical protein VMW27_28875 [Thermoanaerobaculia bacterium]|nr:hypothetical protein [Thermoanaerobaculia bacterium]
MLEAKPPGLFSRDFDIEAEGRKIAFLDIALWREAGEVLIEGQPYKLYREGLMSGAFLLEKEGQVVARAIKVSAFRSQFDLELGTHRCSLKRASIFGRSFSVLQGGDVLGSIRPAGVFTRRALIDLPPDWPAPVQVFVFWLVLVIWNRDRSAAAGSS